MYIKTSSSSLSASRFHIASAGNCLLETKKKKTKDSPTLISNLLKMGVLLKSPDIISTRGRKTTKRFQIRQCLNFSTRLSSSRNLEFTGKAGPPHLKVLMRKKVTYQWLKNVF